MQFVEREVTVTYELIRGKKKKKTKIYKIYCNIILITLEHEMLQSKEWMKYKYINLEHKGC